MTSRVFLDRVQATPDKKDQLTKESASSPCPERTIKLSGKPIPQEVLDDLCARFLLNIPESGMSDHHFLDSFKAFKLKGTIPWEFGISDI